MSTTTVQPTEHHRKRKRPFGVNAIIVLSFLQAAYGLAAAIVLSFDMDSAVPSLASLSVERWLMVYLVVTSLVQLFILVGLWRLERWGWFLIMVNTGVGMFLNIWAYFYSQPNYFAMAISVLIVLYLNQRDVRLAFEKPDLQATEDPIT